MSEPESDPFENDDAAGEVPGADPETFPEPGEEPDPSTGTGEQEALDLDDSGGSAFGGIVESLNSTEPNKKLEEVESIWDPDNGGYVRISRGVQKAMGSGGLPAWLDIVIGVAEVYVQQAQPAASGSSTESEPDDSPGMGGEIPQE